MKLFVSFSFLFSSLAMAGPLDCANHKKYTATCTSSYCTNELLNIEIVDNSLAGFRVSSKIILTNQQGKVIDQCNGCGAIHNSANQICDTKIRPNSVRRSY